MTSVYGWSADGAMLAAQAAFDASAELEGEARVDLLDSAYRAAKAAAKGYSANGKIDKRDAAFSFMNECIKAQTTPPTPPTPPTMDSSPTYTKADAAAYMATPDSPITPPTTPINTPAGTAGISFYSTEGRNGCKNYTIYYFVKEALCIVNMQENDFGRLTEVVQVDADGKSLPPERFQKEAILWFLYAIDYYGCK